MRAAALDIGGTSIKSGVWTGVEDKTEEVRETPTNAGLGGSYVMEQAVKILEATAVTMQSASARPVRWILRGE